MAERVLVSSEMTEHEDAGAVAIKERDLGPQPLDAVMGELGLINHDLVALCPIGLTHKAVQRARKGRRLTPRMKVRVTETLNALLRTKAVDRQFPVHGLFNY